MLSFALKASLILLFCFETETCSGELNVGIPSLYFNTCASFYAKPVLVNLMLNKHFKQVAVTQNSLHRRFGRNLT